VCKAPDTTGEMSFHFKSTKSFSEKPSALIKRRPEVLDQIGEKGVYHYCCKAGNKEGQGDILTLAK